MNNKNQNTHFSRLTVRAEGCSIVSTVTLPKNIGIVGATGYCYVPAVTLPLKIGGAGIIDNYPK